jgi:hypothetical protein
MLGLGLAFRKDNSVAVALVLLSGSVSELLFSTVVVPANDALEGRRATAPARDGLL